MTHVRSNSRHGVLYPKSQTSPAVTIPSITLQEQAGLEGLGEMPSHWRIPEKPKILKIVFTLLCLVGVSQPDLKEVWRTCQTEEEFAMSKAPTVDRITTVTVVVGNCFNSSHGCL